MKVGPPATAGQAAKVDARHQTTAPFVWAIGGVVRRRRRAACGSRDAVTLAEQLAGLEPAGPVGPPSRVIRLGPVELAWVGASETTLKLEDVPHFIGKSPFVANPRARIQDVRDGFVKLLVHAGSGRVLGAQIFGPGAGERIDEVALAIALGAAAEDLARVARAPGTLSEALGEAARAACGWPMMLLR